MNSNLKRPKGLSEEDEDELFRFQEEFLRNKTSQPAAKVVRVTRENQEETKSFKTQETQKTIKKEADFDFESDNKALAVILSDIVEKPMVKDWPVDIESKNKPNQIPKIEKINFNELNEILPPEKRKNKSLFAQNLERQGKLKAHFDLNKIVQPTKLLENEQIKLVEKQILGKKINTSEQGEIKRQIITGDGLSNKKDAEQIHLENLELLSRMKPEEILMEQNKLLQQLDPKIVAFIRRKNVTEQSPIGFVNEADTTHTTSTRPSDEEIIEQLPIKPNKKWLHMDKIEYDKLEWMLKPKNVTKIDPNGNKSARFDFNGNLISPEQDLPVTEALHHHGNEPELAGYTLDELFHLARSKFNQQRVLALQTLGNILRKCHLGDYFEVIKSAETDTNEEESENDKNNLLNQLVEGGILFLLRWSLDDQTESVISASLESIEKLIQPPNQEEIFDYTFDLYQGHQTVCLHPFSSMFNENKQKLSLDKNLNVNEEKDLDELKDDEFIRVDLIRGLFRMNLMERFFYLINKYQPILSSIKIQASIFSILFRCLRHSPEICYEFFEKYSNLCDLIVVKFLPTFIDTNETELNSVLINAANTLKILRLLSSAGPTIAFKIYKRFNLKTKITNYLTTGKYIKDPNLTDSVLKLQTETLRLLKIQILYSDKEIGIECVVDFYEILLEILNKLISEISQNESFTKFSFLQSLISLFHCLILTASEPNLDFVGEIGAGVYSIISSFVQKKFKNIFDNKNFELKEKIHLNLFSVCLNYLIDYLDKMEFLSSMNRPADLLNKKLMYIEVLIDSFIEPFMNRNEKLNQLKIDQFLMSKLNNYSVFGSNDYLIEQYKKIQSNNLSYLPNVSNFMRSDDIDPIGNNPFCFLAAFMRLYNLCFMNRLTIIDDSKFSNTKNFLRNSYLKSYLKSFVKNNCQNKNSMANSFYLSKFENLFVFNLLKTAFNLFNIEDDTDQNEDSKQKKELNSEAEKLSNLADKRFYYILSLSLLLKLKSGDEYLIHEILALFTFNMNYWSTYIDKRSEDRPQNDKSLNALIQYFDKLELEEKSPKIEFNYININFAQSEAIRISKSFIENMESIHIYDLLNQIKFSYLENQVLLNSHLLNHSKKLNKPSNSKPNNLFLSITYSNKFLFRPDWIYAPIISEKMELSKVNNEKEKEVKLTKTVSIVSNSLKFVYLLESYLDSDYLELNIDSTRRYIKLLFVYLFDPEVFLDKQIITILYLLFFKYCQDRKKPLENLNLNQKFDEIISFYDFYQYLLTHYDSTSFGDYLFSHYLIVPLQQNYSIKYRQLFWADFHHLFKYMRFDTDQSKLLIPLKNFVYPNEKNLHMIRLYSQVLLDPNDFKLVCGSKLGYTILVACLNSFIFEHINKLENKVEFDFKKLLVTHFYNLNEKLKKDLIYFRGVSTINDEIEHFEQLPDIRKQWLDQLMA
ncbi:unnamed protein product [Brachionus calyciflorus]|uniref:RNA polymerase II-associated protein 1 n=1 Tax=Brachionus calyciflorus TaxID=104777 RepID=A0A813S1G7_9BILA|nr:unnamed protein product [Brachionus calyciflorus]